MIVLSAVLISCMIAIEVLTSFEKFDKNHSLAVVLTTAAHIPIAIYFGNYLLIPFFVFCILGDYFNSKDSIKNATYSFIAAHVVLLVATKYVCEINQSTLVIAGAVSLLLNLFVVAVLIVDKVFKILAGVYGALWSVTLAVAISQPNKILMVGIILFWISDILIAYFGLLKHSQKLRPFIWLVYSPAIYLIAVS